MPVAGMRELLIFTSNRAKTGSTIAKKFEFNATTRRRERIGNRSKDDAIWVVFFMGMPPVARQLIGETLQGIGIGLGASNFLGPCSVAIMRAT